MTNTKKFQLISHLTERNNIMKRNSKQFKKWHPTSNSTHFDADGRLNSLGRWEYTDGTFSKETAKNEQESRTIGSQNVTDYKVVKVVLGGRLNNTVYANSRKQSGETSFRTGIHGTTGMLAGSYIYWTEGNNVYRQTYDLSGARGRDVEREHVAWWDVRGIPHMVPMVEQVEVRKVRSDKGKAHKTQGQVIADNEVLSENKRARK